MQTPLAALIADKLVEPKGHSDSHHEAAFTLRNPYHHHHPTTTSSSTSTSCSFQNANFSSSSSSTTRYVSCSPEQVELALHAAVTANNEKASSAEESSWATLPLSQRHKILIECANAIDARKEEFAKIDVAETGIPLPVQFQIVEGFAPVALASMQKAIDDVLLNQSNSKKIPSRFGGHIDAKRRPVSPALIIAPFNVPFGTIAPKLFVALLCGCSVIVKPSPIAPTSVTKICLLMHEILSKSGFGTAAVLQVVQGGAAVGEQLVSAKETKCVQFTGAPSTAAKIMCQASTLLKPLLAECGGANALIICRDADMKSVCRFASMAMITLNGQWCMSASRILCHRSRVKEFLEKFKKYLNKRIKLMVSEKDMEGISSCGTSSGRLQEGEESEMKSNSNNSKTGMSSASSGGEEDEEGAAKRKVFFELGPLANIHAAEGLRENIQKLASSSKDEKEISNNIVTLFDVEKVWAESQVEQKCQSCSSWSSAPPKTFLSPTLILEPDPKLAAKTELFGPVVCLHVFGKEEEEQSDDEQEEKEAVRIANLSNGMLACYVFSQNLSRVNKNIALKLNTGMTMLNSSNFCFEPEDPSMEFDTQFYGSSGSGSDGTGRALADFFTRLCYAGVANELEKEEQHEEED